MSQILRLTGACLLLAVTACGGGSGGPSEQPFGAATLSGSYVVVSYLAAGSPASTWATSEFDGVSTVVSSGETNFDGVIGSLSGSLDYAVGADGTLSLFSRGVETSRGGVARDGSCAVASSLQSGTPQILVFLRKGSGLAAPSSDTDFSVAGFAVDDVANQAHDQQGESLFGDATLLASGGFVFDVESNENGLVASGGMVSGTYSVESDGDVGLRLDLGIAAVDFVGALSEEGSCIIVGGGANNGSSTSMFSMVRKGSAMSNASWQGDYWMVGLEAPAPGDDFAGFGALLRAGGDGNWSQSGRRTDLSSANDFSESATYTVAADGAVTLTRGSDTLLGQLSPDGKYVLLGGAGNDSGTPLIWIGCRR